MVTLYFGLANRGTIGDSPTKKQNPWNRYNPSIKMAQKEKISRTRKRNIRRKGKERKQMAKLTQHHPALTVFPQIALNRTVSPGTHNHRGIETYKQAEQLLASQLAQGQVTFAQGGLG